MATNSREVQKRADSKRQGKRARAWWGVLYPESAPSNWRELISDDLVETLISPLHDQDVLPTGEFKKLHYHILSSWKNPVTRETAAETMKRWGVVVQEHWPKPGETDSFKVKDFKQAARYLCHLDQADKHRYSELDVQSIGAIDYQTLVMSAADEDAVLDEIEEFVARYRIISFTSFTKIVRTAHPEWKYFVRHKYSYYIRQIIKSNLWDIEHEGFVAATELWEGADAKASDYDTPSQSSKFQEPRISEPTLSDGIEKECFAREKANAIAAACDE